MSKTPFCEHCIFGKHKRVKFNASVHTTKGTLDYVHADLWGPSRKPSYGGSCYMLTIIDDYSRKVWPYFLKNKDDTFAAFKEWKVMILSLIHISEPTRRTPISYAVFCLKQ